MTALVDAGLATRSETEGAEPDHKSLYTITDAGREHLRKTTFDCRYEVRINDFGGRAFRSKNVAAETAEAAVEKLRRELEAKGERVLSVVAEGTSGSSEWTLGHPFERDL